MSGPREIDPTGRVSSDWDDYYASEPAATMPWSYPFLDPDLAWALRSMGIERGRILDLGTGPGTQAIALASMGFDVVATDVSECAIERARSLGSQVDFRQDDILDSKMFDTFDMIFDRGCLHCSNVYERHGRYVQQAYRLLKPGGLLFLKCFSDHPANYGASTHLFSLPEVAWIFHPVFEVLAAWEGEMQGKLWPNPRAHFVVLRALRVAPGHIRPPGLGGVGWGGRS